MVSSKEKDIFIAYRTGLVFKGAQALIEIVVGILFYVVNTNTITSFLMYVANGELSEIPNDSISDFLTNSSHQLFINGKFFIVFYLLTHGIIKLIIVTGLFLKKKWAYPASLIGLGGLLIYQIYRLLVSYSIFLLLLTVMDLIILWLIWYENRKKNRTQSTPPGLHE